ncbi:MAG: hypothetical protein IKB93_05030 [Clostridia bacterium]|nr:hypothetical protein [Clostridia bacterium]
MANSYEAGIRFKNDCFVKFKYDQACGTVDVTVITAEARLSGTATLEAEEAKKTTKKRSVK